MMKSRNLGDTKETQVNSMDGAPRERIPYHFKDVYKELYNRHEDVKETEEIMAKINNEISDYHLRDIDKVSHEVVKDAASRLTQYLHD